jgi:pimeloyl-ACP methyl ester carboxylesterase
MKKVISKDGTEIAFEKSGSGPAVILVDGALCSSSFGPMPKLVPLLQPHFTVINYDRRGRNNSGDTKPYSVQREVEDIAALIYEAGGSAYIAGLSSGAALALEAAACGLNVKGLLLYEPPFMVDKEGRRAPADSKAQLSALIDANRRGDAVKYFMHDMVGAPAIIVSIMKLTPAWRKLKTVAHTLPYDAAVLGDFSLPVAKASGVKIPALVINGDKTAPQLKHAAEKLSQVMPGAKHLVMRGQSHNVSMTALAPVLIDFFLN